MNREMFYKHNVNKIYGLLLKMTGDSEIAIDLTQDTFYQFFKNEYSFKGKAQPSTYLYRIAINVGINFIRKKQKLRRIFSNMEKEEEQGNWFVSQERNPEQELLSEELMRLINEKLKEMPEKQAQCFYLSKIVCIPQKEIANILGISVSAVESNVFRAKKELALFLHQYLGEKNVTSLSNKLKKGRNNETDL